MPGADIGAREKTFADLSGGRSLVRRLNEDRSNNPPNIHRRPTMDTTFNAVATLPAAPTTTTTTGTASTGRAARWTGRVMSGLIVAFLVLDGAVKLTRVAPVVKGALELGYPIASMVPIGLVLLTCVALYLIPRTAILGAVLLTGYLGGAIATHVRVSSPLFSHTLFPIYVAAFIWGGLYLRDARARAMLAPRGAR
jgi:hypothetical protein